MKLTDKEVEHFRSILNDYFSSNARELPWRNPALSGNFDPYHILVSEIMLQQTQVARVIHKYLEFVQLFPDIGSLAAASFIDVLRMWSGLGYNRRARYLHEFAKNISRTKFPETVESLTSHKGIGVNTASAIIVYSMNKPEVFIETNIRTVYLHHFFRKSSDVTDKQILQLVAQTIDVNNPRHFYWALMDYGTYLKGLGHGNVASKHYAKQSMFKNSNRELRGKILKELVKYPEGIFENELSDILDDERLYAALEALSEEGILSRKSGRITIA